MLLPSVMTEMSPDVSMCTLTGQCPVRLLPVAYTPRSGFMPSGSLVNSVQSLPGLVPFHTSQRTYTMPPIRRAWQWVVSDSQMFTQPVSYSSRDTEYQPTGQLIENIQYEPEIDPCALIRPSVWIDTDRGLSPFIMPTPWMVVDGANPSGSRDTSFHLLASIWKPP